MRGKLFRISAGICGLAVVAGSLTVSVPIANATTGAPSSIENIVKDSNQQTVIEIFNGINAFRASKGLAPLTFSVPVAGIAQKWSDTMAATDTFYHNPDFTTGAPAGELLSTEIIAARWDRSGQGLVDQWIKSPPHNAAMSIADMTTMGIGVAYTDGDYTTPTRYATYATTNIFKYNGTPQNTYASPADYFAGKAPLQTALTAVSPEQPSFRATTFTLPAVTGVRYVVDGVEMPAGTHPVTKNFYNVRVSPLFGYYFPSTVSVTQWGINYNTSTVKNVIVPDPTFNAVESTFQLHAVSGAVYRVNGVVYPAGVYFASVPVTVEVSSTLGYSLDVTRPTTWSYDFIAVPEPLAPPTGPPAEPVDPPTPPVVPTPTPTIPPVEPPTPTTPPTIPPVEPTKPPVLLPPPPPPVTPELIVTSPQAPLFTPALGIYTIPSKVGVVYKINGNVVPAGVYTGTGIITVTAAPADGYTFGTFTQVLWSGDITKPIHAVVALAPSINVSAWTYTIPTTAGVRYEVGGVTKAAGTYTGTGSLNVVAKALDGYRLDGKTTWALNMTKRPLIKSGDLLAIDGSGVLWNYGNSSSPARKMIFPSGYATAKEIFVADWNSDGVSDIVTQWKLGNMTVRYGINDGTFSEQKIIGTGGWSTYEVAVGKFKKTDKYPSIIAKDSAGNLWSYANLSGSAINARTALGSGWKTLQVNLLDWDKDGSMDIIAKDSVGKVLLYRTDGYGKFKAETRAVIGTGWSGFQMQSIKDYAGTGSYGILAKDAAGRLYYYGTGKGSWVARTYKGLGWIPMNISGS